jgi:hypothetical protein
VLSSVRTWRKCDDVVRDGIFKHHAVHEQHFIRASRLALLVTARCTTTSNCLAVNASGGCTATSHCHSPAANARISETTGSVWLRTVGALDPREQRSVVGGYERNIDRVVEPRMRATGSDENTRALLP